MGVVIFWNYLSKNIFSCLSKPDQIHYGFQPRENRRIREQNMYSFFYNPNMLIQSHSAFLILVILRCFYTKRVLMKDLKMFLTQISEEFLNQRSKKFRNEGYRKIPYSRISKSSSIKNLKSSSIKEYLHKNVLHSRNYYTFIFFFRSKEKQIIASVKVRVV